MTEEVKEISEYIDNRIIPNEKWNKIKDYIVSLQNAVNELTSQKKIMILKNEQLQQENEKLKENLCKNIVYERWYIHYKSRCEKANDFIDNYDVFKEFSFPLMKRDIENQIKSSIDYEFNCSFRKKLKNILNGSDEK